VEIISKDLSDFNAIALVRKLQIGVLDVAFLVVTVKFIVASFERPFVTLLADCEIAFGVVCPPSRPLRFSA